MPPGFVTGTVIHVHLHFTGVEVKASRGTVFVKIRLTGLLSLVLVLYWATENAAHF